MTHAHTIHKVLHVGIFFWINGVKNKGSGHGIIRDIKGTRSQNLNRCQNISASGLIFGALF